MTGDMEKPLGPRGMAEELRRILGTWQEKLDAATDPKEQKRIRKHMATARRMERWCKTRAGY